MPVPDDSESKKSNIQSKGYRTDSLIIFAYAVLNTFLIIAATAILIPSNSWYWIPIPITGILFSIVIYTFVRKMILSRIITSILVLIGSIAAISFIYSVGLVFLMFNLIYLCGIGFLRPFSPGTDPNSIALSRQKR